MDRIGPSNSTEVQKGAKLEGATHYAQATAQIIAYVSYVLCMFYHLICIYSYMYIVCIIWYVHFCIFKCTFCMCTCTYTQICVLFEVRHAIKAKKGVQKAFWLRIQWERCDLAATNVWALLHLGRIDVSESCLKKLTSTRWPCNQGFFKHWSMASVKNDALLKRNLGSTPSYFVHQSVSQNQANQRNQPYTCGHLSQWGGHMLHQGWHTCWDLCQVIKSFVPRLLSKYIQRFLTFAASKVA